MVGKIYFFIFICISVFEIVLFCFCKEKFLQAKHICNILVYATNVHDHKGQSHSPNVHNFPQTISINQTSPLARFLEK